MSSLRFVLAMAWRESRASSRRLALLMSAVAVGVAALVAINSFTDNLQESVGRQAKALLGADLCLSAAAPFGPRTEALLREIRSAGGGPAAVEARVTAFGAMAYVPRTSGARLVQVTAFAPGYPFYGSIETDPPGEWDRLDGSGGALVDPTLLAALGAKVGDSLALGEARFPIRGTVLNVPGDVGVRSAFGPRVFIPARQLPETGLLVFGARARHEAYLKLPPGTDAQRLADRFRTALNAERVNLRTVSEDQRRLNDTLARLGRYLGLVALVALLLGGLGVASAVHVFIKRKLDTVAVLRCLGASARQVLAVYLVQAAAIGLLGSLLGAGLGVGVQLLLPRVLSDLLPVDVRLAPSAPALALGVGLGLWVATIFSLLPLLSVRRVSPLAVLRRPYEEAPPFRDRAQRLALVGLGASVVALAVVQAGRPLTGLAFAGGIGLALGVLWLAAFALTRALRRFLPRRLPYLWRQGLANLFRPANQTVMVVLALGFGAFLLDTLLLVQHNLLRDLRTEGGEPRPNLVLFDIQPDQRAAVEAEIRGAGLAAQPAVPIVPMRIQSVKGRPVSQVLGAPGTAEAVRGRWAFRREYRSTYRDRLVGTEHLVAGRQWRAGAWRGPRPEGAPVPISVETGLARELGVGLGDEIVWDVQGVPVASRVASLRDVEWARFQPNFFVVFPEGPLDEAPRTYATLTRIDDPAQRARFERCVAEAFPNVSALDLAQVQRAVEAILDRAALAIRFMALFSMAAGAVVLVGAVASTRYQRLREGVLLKALGATRAQIARVLFAEYLSLGTLAAATAVVLSAAAGWALVRFGFETRFSVPFLALGGLALGVVVLTVAIGLWNSAEVFRRTPLEVLRAE